MKQKTVLLGMSGGVDSSVAALLLKKQGFKVIGCFLQNYPDYDPKFNDICPFIEDNKFAQKVAKTLGIQLLHIDSRKKYHNQVIKPMFKSYSKNFTPNPDTLCNKIIKFPELWKKAKTIKADYIATGHYARIKKTNSGFQLLQGIDPQKDQSYFLHELTQSDLSHTLFPIGVYEKSEVRKIAKNNKFPNWNKKSSRGICFIGKANMKSLLKGNIKEKPGKVLNHNYKLIGTHPGTMYFTIGERIGPRHGVTINNKYQNNQKKKLYVASKKQNTLIVTPKDHFLLKTKKISIKSFRQINPKLNLPKTQIKARFRHLGRLTPGKLIKAKGKYTFSFNHPQEGIAKGQSIVLYRSSTLIAAGEIQ